MAPSRKILDTRCPVVPEEVMVLNTSPSGMLRDSSSLNRDTGEHGGALHRTVHVGGAAQGVQQAAVLRAVLPVKLGQPGEQSGVKRPLLRPGRGIGLVLQQRVQLHTGFTPFL
ncbi:MAG: hypothetical protein ACLRNQ_20940 [Flavonifractor plautii]